MSAFFVDFETKQKETKSALRNYVHDMEEGKIGHRPCY